MHCVYVQYETPKASDKASHTITPSIRSDVVDLNTTSLESNYLLFSLLSCYHATGCHYFCIAHVCFGSPIIGRKLEAPNHFEITITIGTTIINNTCK